MLKITEILMDYEKEQTGMDHMPQLGWKLESDGRNIQQEAYELDIALDQDFCDCVYRSGKVMENASAQIMVKNISLKSMTKYFVRVKVWAGKEESCWAETFFVTGILNTQEWKALFITAENDEDAANSKGTYVRTLLEDIAAELGMCGTMSFLLRKQVGDFYLSEAKTLEEIAAAPYAYLLPAEAAVQDLQELVLTDKQALRITQGVKTTVRGISNGTYRLKTITGDFLGIGSAESELVKAEKILKQFQADAEMI